MVEEDIEISPDVLLRPNKNFVRTDNTISSTTSRDLNFCFKVVLKEAAKEDRLVKQVFYTALSAYTNNPINLAINAPSGEGKTHVLMKVSDLFPEKDVQFIADMSDKAIFHKNGYLGIKNEDGEFDNVEGKLSNLKESLDSKTYELKKANEGDSLAKKELKEEIDEIQKQINAIRDKAVKVIDLNHKILIFLDTPKKGIFEALMSLLSHDKFAVEYHYVDTSSKTGIVTKINVLMGWPAVIFAQAIDFTSHHRYHEIQRRFSITNPRMDSEKYHSAVMSIIQKNCIPDFVYQLKVVSDEEKNEAREIILNIRDDLLSISSHIRPGKNNTFIPYSHLINNLLAKNNTAQDMTFVNKLLNIINLLTNINIKKRPSLEIKPIFSSNSYHIPMALYSDLYESLSLFSNSIGGVRPYVLDWYRNIFLNLYGSKSEPNSKYKNGEVISEERIAVTSQELIDKTNEIMKKHYTSKNILEEFLYPLLNLGYIDSLSSLIDKRANIYFPVLEISNEKSINLFLFNGKNKSFERNERNDGNFTINSDKTQIISNIDEVVKYYSDNENSVMLRFADVDMITDDLTADLEEDEYKTGEEIVDRYYSDSISLHIDDENDLSTSLHEKLILSEEYSQVLGSINDLQDIQSHDTKNSDIDIEASNNLFSEGKKNKIIFSCYYCDSVNSTNDRIDYERHVISKHPGRLAYPDMASITNGGLQPQDKPWEKEEDHD